MTTDVLILGAPLKGWISRGLPASYGHAIRNARECTQDETPERWRVLGPDLDNDELVTILALRRRLVVVTVMGV